MATRMQQRRGTAAQWISTNAGAGPVLNAGEIGWESDTNRFKIGDGVNNWANLDYFADTNSTTVPTFGTSIVFEGATADSYETTLQVTDPTADRTITLPNVTGTVITTGNLSDITDIGVFTSTITMEGSTADAFELTLSAGDPTADRTITFPDATGTVALTSNLSSYAPLNSPTFTGTVTLPANTISQSMMGDDSVGTNEIGGLAVTEAKIADGAVTSVKIANGTIVNEDINASAAIALSKLATDPLARANHTGSQTASTISDFNEAAQDAIGGILGTGLTYNDASNTITVDSTNIQLRVTGVTDTEIGYLDGVTSAIQTQLNALAPKADPTFTGTVSAAALTLSGDLTVNGTTTTINSTTLAVDDKNIVLGDVATPTDTTADGGGITLKGATDKTFNWVDATDSWTSSEHINLASGKSYYMNGTLLKDVSETLANKTLSSAVATTALTLNATAELRLADTDSSHYVGFKAPSTVSTNRIWTLPSTDGTAGQALSTNGSGTLSWATAGGGAAFSELMLIGA